MLIVIEVTALIGACGKSDPVLQKTGASNTSPITAGVVKPAIPTAPLPDAWVLNGCEMYITNGVTGDIYCVAAKTGDVRGDATFHRRPRPIWPSAWWQASQAMTKSLRNGSRKGNCGSPNTAAAKRKPPLSDGCSSIREPDGATEPTCLELLVLRFAKEQIDQAIDCYADNAGHAVAALGDAARDCYNFGR